MIRTIHSDYSHLSFFSENLPAIFATKGEMIYEGRNQIKRFQFNDYDVTVKSFQIPHIINRIAYTFFRPSKAKRSYKHALRLIKKEIGTPTPIACIENRSGGLLSSSYYISTFADYPGLLRELAEHPLEEVRELVEAFAHFTAELHEKGVLHLDYSPGNILYKKTDGNYQFCLVDINRMKFGKINEKKATFNLRRLWGNNEIIAHIAQIYAEDRHFDIQKFVDLTLRHHTQFWKKYTKNHPERKAFIGQAE